MVTAASGNQLLVRSTKQQAGRDWPSYIAVFRQSSVRIQPVRMTASILEVMMPNVARHELPGRDPVNLRMVVETLQMM